MANVSWRARSLKAVLRDALKDAGITAREAARRLGISHTTVNRWLSDADPAPSPEDVSRLLAVLEVVGDGRDRIVSMARATDADWLVSGPPGINPQLASVLACERDARRITECAPSVFPGLLQTSDYARSIIARGGEGLTDQELETRVMMRVARRDALTRRRPVELHAIVGLAAIHGGIGGPEVMAAQLEHVADMTRRDNVTVQAIDMTREWTPAHPGAFILYEFDDMPPTVYLEHLSSGAFLVERADVEAYKTAAETLRREAMSPEETAELIASVIPTSMETTT